MYTCYQVVLVAEDGEYILSEWQTFEAAYDDAAERSAEYGEGQRLEVREQRGAF